MNLFKSLIIISLITTLVKIIGFVKDILMAKIFGAKYETDSFLISFRLINLFRRIFSDGMFFQSFIPILVNYKNKNNIFMIKDFINNIFGFLIIFISIITLICLFTSSYMIRIISPGTKDKYNFELTVKIFKILLPYIMLTSLISFTGSILNIWNNIFITSVSPIIVNISIILFLSVLSNIFKNKIFLLPSSVIIGNILQLLIHIFFIKSKTNLNLTPKFNNINIPMLLNIMSNNFFTIMSILINQISFILNTIFSSYLNPGLTSWFYYSDRIMEFPSGVLGVTLSNIIFPILSKNTNDIVKYSSILNWGLKIGILISVPLSIIIMFLSKDIIECLLQHGNFSDFDTKMTSESLIFYSIGLTSIILVKLLITSFYSLKDTITPLKSSVITLFFTQIFNIILIRLFKHIGLSLSVSINSIFNCLLLFYFLYKKNILIFDINEWKYLIIRIFISSISLLIFLTIYKLFYNKKYKNIYYKILKIISLILISMIIYFSVLYFIGFNLKELNFINKFNT